MYVQINNEAPLRDLFRPVKAVSRLITYLCVGMGRRVCACVRVSSRMLWLVRTRV
jgi:hypothetical protein